MHVCGGEQAELIGTLAQVTAVSARQTTKRFAIIEKNWCHDSGQRFFPSFVTNDDVTPLTAIITFRACLCSLNFRRRLSDGTFQVFSPSPSGREDQFDENMVRGLVRQTFGNYKRRRFVYKKRRESWQNNGDNDKKITFAIYGGNLSRAVAKKTLCNNKKIWIWCHDPGQNLSRIWHEISTYITPHRNDHVP